MKKPKMMLFDYGQTLIKEAKFDGVKGTKEVMKYAVVNKYSRTPEEIQAEADAISRELGRSEPSRRHLFQVEVPNAPFEAYLYESMGIHLSISYEQASDIFWDAAAPGTPSDGICPFLSFLKEEGIRTGVISNMSYSGKSLSARINRLLPEHDFEFIIASSEYIFRKPNVRIFKLALEKAGLQPEEVWYVGDHYACDAVGAEKAGMIPVWYTGAIDFVQDMNQDVLKAENWEALKNVIMQCED